MKKIFFSTWFLFFYSCISYASQNVIILIDRELFTYTNPLNEEVSEDNKESLKSQITAEIRQRLNIILQEHPSENVYHVYAIKPDFQGFYSKNLYIDNLARLNAIGSVINNTDEAEFRKYINTNFYDLLNRNSNVLKAKSKDTFFDTTLLIIFSRSFVNGLSAENLATALTFQEKKNFRYSNEYKYEYTTVADETEFVGDTKSIPVPIYEACYVLTKKTGSIFSNSSGNGPTSFAVDRKTIPNTQTLQVFPVSQSNLPLMVPRGTEVNVEWCRLLFIQGDSSHLKFGNAALPKMFTYAPNTMPTQLKNPLDADSSFPFYEFIKNTMVLNGTTPFDTAYSGKLVVRYNLIDPIYPHAVFNDTIFFKLDVAKPVHMQPGLFKRLQIDNSVLIEYGNKRDPKKEWTQTALAAEYTGNVKIVVTAIVFLSALLIFLIKRYVIGKRRLTLSRL